MRRQALMLLVVSAFAAPVASAAPPSLSASGGPVFVSGEAAAQFGPGHGFQFENGGRSSAANAWLVRVGYLEFGAGEMRALQFFNGGHLYVPAVQGRVALRQTSLDIGLAREFGTLGIRPSIEGTIGASWIEQPSWAAQLQNDRRPGPGSNVPAISGHLAPALSLAAGIEVPAFDRLGLRVSAAARWLPAEHFNGVLLPVRAGAVWPLERADAVEDRASRRGPTLRIASGAGVLRDPARVRGEMSPSVAIAAALEQPLSRGLALSLQGEHVATHDAVPTTRQEMDNLGNLVTVVTGESPLSATLTTATLGLRLAHPLGIASASARAGVGWGRSGGFGTTQIQTLGYYDNTNGTLVPILDTVDYGVGEGASGFAYSCTAGLEFPLGRAFGVFAEAGALGLHVSRDDLLVIPVRMGLSIR